MTVELPYCSLPIDQSDVRYSYGPDSVLQTGVPAGALVEFDWTASTTYPGTSRKFWVHVPAQYDGSEPASLMVFQDGMYYLDPEVLNQASFVSMDAGGPYVAIDEYTEPIARIHALQRFVARLSNWLDDLKSTQTAGRGDWYLIRKCWVSRSSGSGYLPANLPSSPDLAVAGTMLVRGDRYIGPLRPRPASTGRGRKSHAPTEPP